MDLQGFNSGMSNTAFSITLDSIQEVRKLRIMNEELSKVPILQFTSM